MLLLTRMCECLRDHAWLKVKPPSLESGMLFCDKYYAVQRNATGKNRAKQSWCLSFPTDSHWQASSLKYEFWGGVCIYIYRMFGVSSHIKSVMMGSKMGLRIFIHFDPLMWLLA